MKALAPERKADCAVRPQATRAAPALAVQRSATRTATVLPANASDLVDRAMTGASAQLDPRVRGDMEPRFGYDFSQVRVHADGSSHAAARALNARAFTVSDHVFFAAGQYAPAGGSGRRLIAHELAHVVQQRSGDVGGTLEGGLRVSRPGDQFERAADASADRALAGPAGGLRAPIRSAAGSPSAKSRTVQRFLAGDAGHGGVEEEALQEAGFSKDEAHDTYFGNWLRDFSQIPDSQASNDVKVEFIKVLATGEFGRAPTEQELGRYLASEHVDRPDGGDSAENTAIGDAQRAQRRAFLSTSQQQWFDQEQTGAFKKKIADAAAASGLPDYIERAKEHAKQQIAEAARLGRTRAGELALGNGLHAVEDYFAHSNFIEVALTQLVAEHAVPPTNPAVEALGRYIDVDPAAIGRDVNNRPQIVTGTSAPGPSQAVGLMEVLKAELKNANLRAAFLRGAATRYGWGAPQAGARAALGAVGGVIGGGLGAVGGAIAGLGTGAVQGAAAGWRGARHWWSKPLAAIGGFFSGAFRGAGRGARTGALAGRRVGSAAGRAVGGVLGGAAGVVLTPAIYLVLRGIFLSLGTPALIAASQSEGKIERRLQRKSRETVDPSGKLSPTHSQIAKDDIDHPLHNAAARLAHDADLGIGQAMIDVWSGRRPVSDAQRLVDVYLAHPAVGDWWKATLLDAVSKARSTK